MHRRLKQQIEISADNLTRILREVTLATSVKTLLPAECYNTWQARSELHRSLRETAALLGIRDEARTVLDALLKDDIIVDRTSNKVRFVVKELTFATARHLALSAYVTTTWSIYDRLANICGRLIGHESVGNNPLSTTNPKLCDFFIDGSKEKHRQVGFSLGKIVPIGYGWPAKVSYLVRNSLVHDGQEIGGVLLFAGDALGDGFNLNTGVTPAIEQVLGQTLRTQCCRASDLDFPWYGNNLLSILDVYHAEVDTMFVNLLKWSVDSFVAQVTSFSERDKAALSAASLAVVP
jgi:hypothetical protein